MSKNGYDPKVAKRLARYAEAVRLVDEGKARPQVVAAVECIRAGMNGVEAAQRLGIARSSFYQRLSDPTDEANRARKARHSGTCIDCGGPTDGTNGREKAPERCQRCVPKLNVERDERIIDAWERGEKAKAIAKREGMTETAVLTMLDDRRRSGEPIARHSLSSHPAVVDRRQKRIVALWAEGKTCAQIAEIIGSNQQSVAYMVYRMRKQGYDLPYRQKVAAMRDVDASGAGPLLIALREER